MSSGDLVPNDHDQPEPASNEVQFALVIARMIDTVQNNPEHMRQAVYDLARYRLQEQFACADAKNIRRTEQALEAAIRGVEEFSKQQIGIPTPPPVSQLGDGAALPRNFPALEASPPAWLQRHLEIDSQPVAAPKPTRAPRPVIKWTAGVLVVLGGILVAFQQRERLASFAQYLSKYDGQAAPQQPTQVISELAPKLPLPAKPNPLRPTDYGVYAIGNDSLAELPLLPGRPPDIRVAVSAAWKMTSRTLLPNGHPKFIVFRRDATTNITDRAEVRTVARIAREFSAEGAGRKPEDGDSWVIRNVSFPFRSSPLPDNPEMYELHSEDPALELTPGRYALVLKNQAYDFSVEGKIIDPKQCIERIVATNGTFYTDCKKP
jgi:hypothetical protein